MLCIWLDLQADTDLYMTELHKKMAEWANGGAVYGTKFLKTKIKEKYIKIRCILQKAMVDLM